MKSATSTGLLMGAVIATAITVALIERSGGQADSDPRPMASNGDARGLLAARRYLAARGSPVHVLRDRSATKAGAAGVLLLAGPTERVLSRAEVSTLMEAVRGGLTLLLFAPDTAPLQEVQPALAREFEISTSKPEGQIPTEATPGRDRSEVVLPWTEDPILGEGERFLARVREGLSATGFEPIAGSGRTPVILRRDLEQGRVYLFATPSLIENHRIDLADNLHLLEGFRRLAGGRAILFDDEHHLPPARSMGSRLRHPAVAFAGLQALVATLLLLLALGRRFGPIRPLQIDPRRRTLEYVDSLAALLRRSRQEGPLCAAAYRKLRHDLWRRHGIRVTLPLDEAAERFAQRTGLPPEALRQTAASCLSPEATVLGAQRAVARLEARLGARTMA